MSQAELLRLSLSLVLVIALIFLAAWVARRSGLLRNQGQAQLQVIAAQSLGGRNRIVIVEVEQARLVLGITQQHISLLHTLPKSSASTTPPSEFQTQLQQATHTTPSESSSEHPIAP